MRSFTLWKSAKRPNYDTNTNLQFPYSEIAWLGKFYVVKIPDSLNDMIDHVDYWGEGKVEYDGIIRGFSNCYNVNHQYQLVRCGPDLSRKIPNRVPVRSDDECDTRGYIKDNSVLTVTIAGARITCNCVKDIARIVNSDHGKVVVYAKKCDNPDITALTAELEKKNLILMPNANLSPKLTLTFYDKHYVFVTAHEISRELKRYIDDGNYDSIPDLAKCLEDLKADALQFNMTWIARLFSEAPQKVMTFAYKLWHGDAKHIFKNLLLESFQLFFNDDNVTIVNKQYRQPLKLDMTLNKADYTRVAWGDQEQAKITSKRVSWKIRPVWSSEGVTFKLYNNQCAMYLQLDTNKDVSGDRKAFGSSSSNVDSFRFYLEPLIKNGSLVFIITNYEHGQGLKLDVKADSVGDRLLWGHNGSVKKEEERFWWVIDVWSDTETSKDC